LGRREPRRRREGIRSDGVFGILIEGSRESQKEDEGRQNKRGISLDGVRTLARGYLPAGGTSQAGELTVSRTGPLARRRLCIGEFDGLYLGK